MESYSPRKTISTPCTRGDEWHVLCNPLVPQRECSKVIYMHAEEGTKWPLGDQKLSSTFRCNEIFVVKNSPREVFY